MTSFARHGVNLATFDILMHAESGDLKPLARHLESGGYLCPALRHFLAAHLRGEVRHGPGLRRTWAQIKREMEATNAVRAIQMMEEIRTGKACSEYRAAAILRDELPDLNDETLKTWLRHAKARKARYRRVKKGPQSSP